MHSGMDGTSKKTRVKKKKWLYRKCTTMPLEQAIKTIEKIALEKNITCFNEWRTYAENNPIPDGLPVRPDRTYKGEYKKLNELLGLAYKPKRKVKIKKKKKRRGRPKKPMMSFEEAKKTIERIALKNNIHTITAWFRYASIYRTPAGLPLKLYEAYHGKYETLSEFLGSAYKCKQWLTYQAAKKYLKQFKIKSYPDFKKWHKTANAPWIPYNPNKFYGDDWISWSDFLSHDRGGYNLGWRPYKEALKWVHTQQVKNFHGWRKLVKDNKVPPDIPKRPDFVYKEEWKSWKEWCGNTLSVRLEVVQNKDPIIYIIKEKNLPLNIYTIATEKGGLKRLEEREKEEGFKILRLYEYNRERAQILKEIIDRNCSKWWESDEENQYIVQNIFAFFENLEYYFKSIMR